MAKYLGGNGVIDEVLATEAKPDPFFGQDSDFATRCQAKIPCIPDNKRVEGFTEAELGYKENVAVEEAKRCLRCDMRLRVSPPMLPPIKIKSY